MKRVADTFSIVVLLLLLLLSAPTRSVAQNGVTLLDTLNRPHGISPQGTRYSSCWGWVSPDGREYALIGVFTGTSIIDLNVSPIREIAFVPGPTASWCYREIKTYKQYAYIVSEGGRGVQILDLSRLPDTTGIFVREFNYVNAGRNIQTSHTVTLADGYLYLNGSNGWSPAGTLIFSLKNNPTNPEYVGQYQPQYIHDSYVRNDILYAAAIYSGGGLYVVDVSDKANPQLIRKISYTGSGTHHAWATIDGRYALTTDEIGSTVSSLKVWDMQNLGGGPPYIPVASFTANPARKIHNVHGRGHYAYISHYTEGMYVLDLRNPPSPVQAGFYDSYPGAPPANGFDGCWAVYPYFPSGRWIGSDMQTGLYLFRFTGLAPRIRSPLLAPANSDTFAQGVAKTFRWRSAAKQAEDPHYYQVHFRGPGLDTLLTTRDTSMTLAPFALMQNGQTYRWHVWIKDEYTEVSSRDTFQLVYRSSGASGTGETPEQPITFRLMQNYPNPFNPTTTIEYSLPRSSHVELTVFSMLGELVATPVREVQSAGRKSVQFDASRSRHGRDGMPSGVYLYRLRAGEHVEYKKMMLVR